MAAARVPMEARMRVAAYFEYVDDDLHNLDDATVLDELNVALRFAMDAFGSSYASAKQQASFLKYASNIIDITRSTRF